MIRSIRRRNIELKHLYKVLDCRPMKATIGMRNAIMPKKRRIKIKNLFEREAEVALKNELAEAELERELESQ